MTTLLKKCYILIAAALFAATAFLTSAQTPPGPISQDQIVVMISVDGLAGYYLDDTNADMPVIRGLARDGARAQSMKASTPSVTWPTHTAIITGASPGTHGVVGNNYLDRKTKKKVALIGDPRFDKDEIVKVPTIYDAAKQAGLKTASIRWPATRNAKTLDWAVPDSSISIAMKYSTPALLTEYSNLFLEITQTTNSAAKKKDYDELATELFLDIIKDHRPQLALLHLTDVDHIEHLNGPRTPEAYAAIKRSDVLVGEVWNALKAQYPGKATLVVVSDHGFSPINKQILPNVVLKQAGLAGKNAANGVTVRAVPQGGCAFLYILGNGDKAEAQNKILKAFNGLEGIEQVVEAKDFKKFGVGDPTVDPRVPDMLLFGKMGYSFGDTAAGSLPFNEKPESKGTHGHNPELPDLHAAFVVWGAGVKKGVNLGEISNTSVAPTIAKLLGVPFNSNEGKALDAALSK